MSGRSKTVPMNFKGMAQADVPQGRNGKHKAIGPGSSRISIRYRRASRSRCHWHN